MNFTAVLEWAKANALIVVFSLLIIAAPISLWFVAQGLNKKVQAEVKSRADNLPKLAALRNTEIETPGSAATTRGVINERFLESYAQVAQALAGDTAELHKIAVEHNRKQRGVLMSQALPQIPSHLQDVTPKRFHDTLQAAYADLLTQIRAGMPPPLESMRDELVRIRNVFITQELRKDPAQPLDPQEQKQLTDRLGKARMAMYVEAAEKLNIYASIDSLGMPRWSDQSLPSPGELYGWQWRYWVTQDILQAIKQINGPHQSVLRAPVKQIISLSVSLPANLETRQPGQGAAPRAGAGGGFGFGQPSPAGGEPDSAAPAAPAVDPKTPVPTNYSASITGRVSNHLYDVVNADLDIIVDASRLPQLIDALAKWNFMTVLDVEVSKFDPFEAAQEGFVYGAAPIGRARLRIESLWLRAWTQQFMPQSVKQALGVPMAPPSAPVEPAAPTT